jgi:septin family protein
MDKIRTEDVQAIYNSLKALNDHKDLINADVAFLMVEALHKLETLTKEVLYSEYRADCVAEEGS